MSGSKQHYIPQLILRRFGIQKSGREKVQVCIYTKDRPPFISATDGVGAQRFFYSTLSEEETLDDRITRHENELAADLAVLDSIAVDEAASGAAASRVIVHLTVRSDHTRRTIMNAGQMIASEGLDLFKDPDWLRRALGLDSDELPPAVQVALRDEMAKLPGGEAILAIPGVEAKLKRQMKALFTAQQPHISAMVESVQDRFREKLPERVKAAHGKSLKASLIPAPRLELLQSLKWTVRAGPANGAILPDCVALAQVNGDPRLVPALILSKDSVINAVYMPLSPYRILVGAPNSVEAPDQWNAGAAAASMDFFVATQRDLALSKLAPLIGTSVKDMLYRELGSAFAEDPAGLLDRSSERTAPD